MVGFRRADPSIEAIVGELAGMAGLRVGDLDQAVGGIPLVTAFAVVEQVAVGVVLVATLPHGLYLIEFVDADDTGVTTIRADASEVPGGIVDTARDGCLLARIRRRASS